MRTAEFDFELPDRLIAQSPVEPRDSARLMVIDRAAGRWSHHVFHELPSLLRAGDVLVRNNTRVVPARLLGRRATTGGAWEGLFLRQPNDGCWEVLATTRGKPRAGERIEIDGGLSLTLVERGEGGRWVVRPESNEPVDVLLEKHGRMPLPPYIRRGRDQPCDRGTYQTVFAHHAGAVAAPTAGLHFTPELFVRLQDAGVNTVDVTLHVGVGTFRPIATERVEDHAMHAEWAEIEDSVAAKLNDASSRGRIVAVGTTAVRTLESAVDDRNAIQPFRGETGIYIQPGHAFRAIDALITNFHLPRSSLLVLVSAFAGVELVRAAYAEAIRENYRFYSYGDAMLIV